ncbi:MAG: GWxTD domain-containing protein [Candidatus Kapaibacterium sp.]
MKRYLTRLVLLGGLLCIFSPVFLRGQHIPLTVDAAQFRYDDTHTLWELYYTYADTSVQYIPAKSKSGYVGSLYCKVVIHSSVGIEAETEWIADNYTDERILSHSKNLIGQKSFILSKGQYSVDIFIKDVNDTSRSSHRSFPIVVHSFPQTKLTTSDMQIASSIEPTTERSASEHSSFIKNNSVVVPNPAHECIGAAPNLALYAEIYNAATFIKDSIIVEYKILDGAKREQFALVFPKKVVGNAQVESVTIPLDALASGVYYAEMCVRSLHSSADSALNRVKFYVLNPEMPAELQRTFSEDELFQQSEFATLSPERVQDEFIKAKVLATQAEVQLFESLTEVPAKQKFLFRFWKTRDPREDTPENERLVEFRKAIQHANTYYSNILIKDGWRTDPGRVLRKYGFPTQIDRHPASSEARPYEEWLYGNIQGGVNFQFVDLKGIGNYVQVNSTANGEPRNDNWLQKYVLMFQTQDDQIK